MRVAKHDTAVGREEVFVDRASRWELLVIPVDGETRLGRITPDQARTYFIKRGPQRVLDQYFPGAKIETVEIRTPLALPAPETEVVLVKQVAMDSDEGAALLAAANAIAQEAGLQDKPKRTRKAPTEKTTRRKTATSRAA